MTPKFLTPENPLLAAARLAPAPNRRTLAEKMKKFYPWVVLISSWIIPVVADLFPLPFVAIYFLARASLPGGEALFAKIPEKGLFGALLILSFVPIYFLVWGWLALFEKRGLISVGFFRQARLIRYLVGFLAGMGMMLAAGGLLALMGVVVRHPAGQSPFWLVVLGVLLILPGWVVQGAAEEVLIRGFLMPILTRQWGLWSGIIVSSLVFSSLHLFNPHPSILAIINLALYGLFACLYALREGSLWGIAGLHAAWNWAQGDVLGLQVSGTGTGSGSLLGLQATGPAWVTGGAFGPEGGIVITLILVVGTLLVLYLPKKGQPEDGNGELTRPEGN